MGKESNSLRDRGPHPAVACDESNGWPASYPKMDFGAAALADSLGSRTEAGGECRNRTMFPDSDAHKMPPFIEESSTIRFNQPPLFIALSVLSLTVSLNAT